MPTEREKSRVTAQKHSNEDYAEISKVAFNTAYSITRQRDDSEDIAQVVTMRFLLNQEKINPEKTRNWVVTVSKNESYLMLNKNGREIAKEPGTFEDFENKITDSFEDEAKQQEVTMLLERIKDQFPEKERAILDKYFNEGKKLTELCSKGGKVNRRALIQKLYRLRKDLRAEYNIKQGMKASKEIVSCNLNQNIIRFIKKYKECLKKRSFASMNRYFQDMKIPHSVPRFNIQEIIDYDVILTGRNEYKLVSFFSDKNNGFDCFETLFSLDSTNTLKVKSIPNNDAFSHYYVMEDSALSKTELEKIDDRDTEGYIKISGGNFVDTIQTLDTSAYEVREVKQQKKIRLEDTKEKSAGSTKRAKNK